MKKIILAFVLIISSCKKDDMPILIGQSYAIKSNIFSKGAFQPISPIKVDSLYIDPSSGLPFARAMALIDWGNFDKSNAGNKIVLQDLIKKGINFGDQRYIEWYISQDDLSH